MVPFDKHKQWPARTAATFEMADSVSVLFELTTHGCDHHIAGTHDLEECGVARSPEEEDQPAQERALPGFAGHVKGKVFSGAKPARTAAMACPARSRPHPDG